VVSTVFYNYDTLLASTKALSSLTIFAPEMYTYISGACCILLKDALRGNTLEGGKSPWGFCKETIS
jgi:hypothetical protein